jgi:septal ring factor EnvC (AmiA/AmiB activator)
MNDVTIAYITAISGAIIGIIGIIISLFTARNSATRQEVDSLRSTIRALTEENDRLRRRIIELENDTAARDRKIDELEVKLDRMEEENISLKKERQIETFKKQGKL